MAQNIEDVKCNFGHRMTTKHLSILEILARNDNAKKIKRLKKNY